MRKKILITILAGGLSFSLDAARVEWNVVSVDYDLSQPYLALYYDQIGTGLKVSAHAWSYMEFANTFALAQNGDIVNDNYIENKGTWFAYARLDDWENKKSRSDYSILVTPEEPVVLAFRSETSDNEIIFGWVELGLDVNGNLTALCSAWDKDGGPMIVGGGSAIPEPHSGLLLLVGGALLALWRRLWVFRK